MKRKARLFAVLAASVVALGLAATSHADLLGNILGFPQILFASGNTNIAGGVLTVNSAPVALRLTALSPPILINPSGGFEAFNAGATVDGSCGFVAGIGGDDVLLFGEVDLGGGDIRSGTLLTGEVADVGTLDSETTDLFDFRVTVTGGLLADLYVNEDLAILVSSENSTFTGDCSMGSMGEAKGTAGSTPPILPSEGCTPGYWKQKHHFDSWVNYAPTDDFATVFGRVVPGVTDLESALRANGGGVNALARHAVAALLNVANGDVNVNDYATEADVIAAFQAAFDSGDYEPQKNAFESLNEEGCPLN